MSELTSETLHIINAGLKKGLDISAAKDESESERAWMKARELMIQHELKVECLVGTETVNDEANASSYELAENRRMPFGKYSGKTLLYIAQNDFPYLEWLADEADIRDNGLFTDIMLLRTRG